MGSGSGMNILLGEIVLESASILPQEGSCLVLSPKMYKVKLRGCCFIFCHHVPNFEAIVVPHFCWKWNFILFALLYLKKNGREATLLPSEFRHCLKAELPTLRL